MRTRKDPDVRDDYDFSAGVRGKYAAAFAKASNVVVLEPDVARKFKTAASVNRALREQMTRRRRSTG